MAEMVQCQRYRAIKEAGGKILEQLHSKLLNANKASENDNIASNRKFQKTKSKN